MEHKKIGGFNLSLLSISIVLLFLPFLSLLHQRIESQAVLGSASSAVVGDINGDTKLDIIDFNLLLGCYSDLLPPLSCDPAIKEKADLNNDGKVNQYDYNIFIRNIIALANPSPTPTNTPVPSNQGVTHWLITTNILNGLRTSDPATAAWFFNTPNAFVKSNNVSGFSTTPIAGYTSYAQFQQDIGNGTFPKGVGWVMYGIESTTNSPLAEKQHPTQFLKAFALLAHQHNLKIMEVPGRDLMQVPGADCVKKSGENLDQAYIRCQIPAASHFADIYQVEAQADQSDTTAYTTLVKEAVDQVRSVSPTIVVMSGLTTDRGDTVSQIFSSWQATHMLVSGYWMNSTTATLPVAAQALDKIRAVGGK